MTTFPILFGGLMAWGIYRRIRRNIGRQLLRPVRITISLTIFSLLSLALLYFSRQSPQLLLGIGGGLAVGVSLGFLGLKLTQFETTSEGHFYTPNLFIGIALSVLFAGRVVFRLGALHSQQAASQPSAFQSPLTLFIFGLMAGYYLVYYIGLFVHTHDRVPG